MATADTLPNLLDIDQLAEHLGTSRRHVRRLIAERRIPYVKVGRLIRFDPADVSKWVDDRRVAGTRSL
jgi:excisionase family DNA binding protein